MEHLRFGFLEGLEPAQLLAEGRTQIPRREKSLVNMEHSENLGDLPGSRYHYQSPPLL